MTLTLNPNIEVRESPIQGKGLFTKVPVKKGEKLWISIGGERTKAKVYSEDEFQKFQAWCIAHGKQWDAVALGNGMHEAAVSDRENHPENYGNHSCEPNLSKDHVALRDIAAGQELTLDYAQFSGKDWRMACNCGAQNCKGTVVGLL